MIPVIIILPDGSSFNYFNKDMWVTSYIGLGEKECPMHRISINNIDGTEWIICSTQNKQLRDTVLRKLHKAVPEVVGLTTEKWYGENSQQEQVCIKIYLKNIIVEAEEELKKQNDNTKPHPNTDNVK